jgi:hypothetical protein
MNEERKCYTLKKTKDFTLIICRWKLKERRTNLMDLLEAGKIDQRRIFGEERIFLMHFFYMRRRNREIKLDGGGNEMTL